MLSRKRHQFYKMYGLKLQWLCIISLIFLPLVVVFFYELYDNMLTLKYYMYLI